MWNENNSLHFLKHSFYNLIKILPQFNHLLVSIFLSDMFLNYYLLLFTWIRLLSNLNHAEFNSSHPQQCCIWQLDHYYYFGAFLLHHVRLNHQFILYSVYVNTQKCFVLGVSEMDICFRHAFKISQRLTKLMKSAFKTATIMRLMYYWCVIIVRN